MKHVRISDKATSSNIKNRRRVSNGHEASTTQHCGGNFGDLVDAAFDHASQISRDPRRQAELAASHLGRLLSRIGDRRISQLVTRFELESADTASLDIASTPSPRRARGRIHADVAA